MSDSLAIDRRLDEHIQVFKSKEGDLASLSVATEGNGARVSGDLEVTGNVESQTIYPGQILGYTAIGIDSSRDSVQPGAVFSVTDADHKVTFLAPPSGKVEIEISISVISTVTRWLVLGLADSALGSPIDFPNANDVTNEHLVGDIQAETYPRILNHKWVVEGLTAGTSYTWWLSSKTEQAGRVTLHWGGDATSEYLPFIMKATALPIGVYTG